MLTPIRIFDGRIDALGDAMAGEPTDNGPYRRTDRRSYWPDNRTYRGAGRGAPECCPDARSDRVRTRRAT